MNHIHCIWYFQNRFSNEEQILFNELSQKHKFFHSIIDANVQISKLRKKSIENFKYKLILFQDQNLARVIYLFILNYLTTTRRPQLLYAVFECSKYAAQKFGCRFLFDKIQNSYSFKFIFLNFFFRFNF